MDDEYLKLQLKHQHIRQAIIKNAVAIAGDDPDHPELYRASRVLRGLSPEPGLMGEYQLPE